MRITTVAGLAAAHLLFNGNIARADVFNQDTPLPPEAVIVVRGEARFREDAPLSGVGIGADRIARMQLNSLDSVAIAVPGLSMINDQDPGTNIVSLRGVTTDRLQQAAIAYVIDDVPLADTELFTGPLFDVARIDVLRGPQGALYGKSAAGGAIEVRTHDPREDAGAVSLALGDGNLRESFAAGSANLEGGVRVRVAGRWSAADGWITNRTLNRVIDAEESRAVRARLLAPVLNGDLDATLLALEEDGGAAWASSGNVTGRFGGKLSGAALQDPIGDFEGRSKRNWVQGAVRYRGAIADNTELFILGAQDRYRKRWQEELDYRPGPLTFFGQPLFPAGLQPIRQPTDIDATTLEARITHRNLQVLEGEATVRYGLFAQRVDRVRVDDFGPLLFGAPASRYTSRADQRAAYVGADVQVGAIVFQADVRLDQDIRTQTISNTATGVQIERRRRSFSRAQPKIAASYRFSPSLVGYASFGEGFRSGGFNPRPAPSNVWQAEFAPEITKSLEIGAKGEVGAWQFELSAFGAEISDYQNYTFLDGQSVTLTVDAVRVRGGEALIATQLADVLGGELDMSVAAAYADSKIKRFTAPDPLIPGAVRNYSGKRVPNAPLWSAAFNADWRQDPFSVGATFNATGETFFEIDNALRAPSKSWLDLRASLDIDDITFAIVARNITDERWAISAFGQGMLPLLAGLGPDGPFDTYTLNRGRQVRFEVRKTF